jgi:hypothetical protein
MLKHSSNSITQRLRATQKNLTIQANTIWIKSAAQIFRSQNTSHFPLSTAPTNNLAATMCHPPIFLSYSLNFVAVHTKHFETPTSYAKHQKDYSRRMLNPKTYFNQYLFSEHLALLIWTSCVQ